MDSIYTDAIQRLYLAYFNRPADPISLQAYEDILQDMLGGAEASQADLELLAETYFSPSQEYIDLYAGLSNSQIVNSLYNNLFGRDAEPEGLLYWTGELNAGRETFASIALQLTYSAQGTDAQTIDARITAATAFTEAVDTTAEIIGYQGNAAAAEAREWLAQFDYTSWDTSDPNAGPTQEQVDEGVSSASNTVVQGEDINLTTGNDNVTITTTGVVDNIYGYVQAGDSGIAGDSTLNAGDVIDGNGDTKVRITFEGDVVAERYSFIQDVATFDAVSGAANSSVVFQAIDWTDVGAVSLASGVDGGDVTFANLESSTTGSIGSVGGTVTLGYEDGLTVTLANSSRGGASFDGTDATVSVLGNASEEGEVWVESDGDATLNSIAVGGASSSDVADYGLALIYNGEGSLSVSSVDVEAVSAYAVIENNDGGSIVDTAAISIGAIGVVGKADPTNDGLAGLAAVGVYDNDLAVIEVGPVAAQLTADGGGAYVELGGNDNSDVTVGAVNVLAQDDGYALFAAYDNESSALTVGDVDIEVGDTGSGAAFYMVYNNDSTVSVGNIDLAMGDAAVETWGTDSAYGIVTIYDNDDSSVVVGNIDATAGANQVVDVEVYDNDGGDVTTGRIDVRVGEDSYVSVDIDANDSATIEAGDVRIDVSGSGSSTEVYVSANDNDVSNVVLGDVDLELGGGASVSISVDYNDSSTVTVGNIKVASGGDFNWVRNSLAHNDNAVVTMGDVDLMLDGQGLAFVQVNDNNSSTAEMGDISITAAGTAGSAATLDVWSNDNASVLVGDLSVLTPGSFADFNAEIKNNDGASVTVGDIDVAMGGAADANVSVEDHDGATVVVGNVDIAVSSASSSSDVDMYVDYNDSSTVTIGNVSVTAEGSGADFYGEVYNNDGSSVTLGDIDVNLGESADAYLYVSNNDSSDVTIGAVGMTGGDDSYAYIELSDNENSTVTVGNVDATLGDDSYGYLYIYDDAFSNESAAEVVGASYSVGNVTMTAGNTASLSVDVYNEGNDVTIGDITQKAGDDSYVYVEMEVYDTYVTSADRADLSVGNISLTAGNDSFGNVDITGSDNVTVGDVTLSFGQLNTTVDDYETYSVSISGAYDTSDSVTVGNISIDAGMLAANTATTDGLGNPAPDASDAYLFGQVWVYGYGQDVTVGNVNVALSGSYTEDAVRDIVQEVDVYITGEITGDLTVGNIAVSVDEAASIDVTVWASGDDATESVGSVTVGDIDVMMAESGDLDINVSLTHTISATYTGSTSSADYVAASMGGLAVGDITVNAADNAYVHLDVELYAGSGDVGTTLDASGVAFTMGTSVTAERGTLGDVSVGDVSVAADLDLTFSYHLSVTSYFHNIGNVTVGDISVVADDNAAVDIDFEIHAYNGASIGDVSVGFIDVALGASSTFDGDFEMSFTADNGDIGDVTFGGYSVTLGENAEFTDDVNFDVVAYGDVGNVTIGDRTWNLGKNAEFTSDEYFDVDAYSTTTADGAVVGGTIGNVAFGAFNLVMDGATDAQYFNAISVYADKSVGGFSMGDFDVDVDGYLYQLMDVTVTANSGDVGDVTLGSQTINLAADASFDDYNELTMYAYSTDSGEGGNIGDISIGSISYVLGTSATADSGIDRDFNADGDIGNVTIGDLSFDGGKDSYGYSWTFDFDADGSIGDVTVGDISIAVDTSASFYSFELWFFGDEGIGNVTIGDISYIAGTDADLYTIEMDISASSGDVGNVTVGDITVRGGMDADLNSVELDIDAYGSVGDVTVGAVDVILDDNADFDYVYVSIDAGTGVGDVTLGDVSLVNNNGDYDAVYTVYADVTSGDIGDITIGDVVATVTGSRDYSAAMYNDFDATGAIGNITVGDVSLFAGGAGVTAARQDNGAYFSLSASVDASFSEDASIGDVTLGNISVMATDSNEAQYDIRINAYAAYSASTTSSTAPSATIGDVTIGNISVSSSGRVLSAAERGSQSVADYQNRNDSTAGQADQVAYAEADIRFDTSVTDTAVGGEDSAGDIGDVTIGDITVEASLGGEVYVYVDANDMTGDDVLTVGDITFINSTETVDYGGTVGTETYYNSAHVIIDAGAANVSLGVNVDGDGTVGFSANPADGSGAGGPVGNYLEVVTDGDVKLDIDFDVSVSATDVYTVAGVHQNFVNQTGAAIAEGDITLGTVDYSGYVLTGSASTTQDIDLTAYAGDMTIIGTSRNDDIRGSRLTDDEGDAYTMTVTGGDGDDDFYMHSLGLDITVDSTLDDVAYHTIMDFQAGPDSDDLLRIDAFISDDEWAEEEAGSFDEFIAVALDAMSDAIDPSQLVAVQVGDDVWIAIDEDGDEDIDTIIKLVGVSLDDFNFVDFEQGT